MPRSASAPWTATWVRSCSAPRSVWTRGACHRRRRRAPRSASSCRSIARRDAGRRTRRLRAARRLDAELSGALAARHGERAPRRDAKRPRRREGFEARPRPVPRRPRRAGPRRPVVMCPGVPRRGAPPARGAAGRQEGRPRPHRRPGRRRGVRGRAGLARPGVNQETAYPSAARAAAATSSTSASAPIPTSPQARALDTGATTAAS